MVDVIVLGPYDDALIEALIDHGLTVEEREGPQSAAALREIGIDETTSVVLTAVELAPMIPIIKDCNPRVTVDIYANGSIPDVFRGQLDRAIDPALVGHEAFAEAIANNGPD